MKTIEISDEMYDKLMDLSKEMNSQNHRGTAMPYFFQVASNELICGIDGDYDNDGFVWLKDGEQYDCDIKSMKEALVNEGVKTKKTDKEHDFISLMEESGFDKGYFKNDRKLTNCFFTEKACKDHIKKNGYHYEKPYDYLSYAFRNPEMELVQQFLCEISGGKIHK